MIRVCLIGSVLLLVACASFTEEHSRTLLMDRATGEMEECVVDKWRNQKSYEVYRACIRDFEQQGYTVWSQY